MPEITLRLIDRRVTVFHGLGPFFKAYFMVLYQVSPRASLWTVCGRN